MVKVVRGSNVKFQPASVDMGHHDMPEAGAQYDDNECQWHVMRDDCGSSSFNRSVSII